MRVRPGSVLGQGPSLEVAEVDVVQLREHDPRNLAPLESEVGGLLRALELGGDAEAEVVPFEELTEVAGLLAPGLGEGAGRARLAVRSPDDRELALAVPCQNDRVHGRYATASARA